MSNRVSPAATVLDLFPPLPYESPRPAYTHSTSFLAFEETGTNQFIPSQSSTFDLHNSAHVLAARSLFLRYVRRELPSPPSSTSEQRQACRELLFHAAQLSARARSFLSQPTTAKLHRLNASLSRVTASATSSRGAQHFLNSFIPPPPPPPANSLTAPRNSLTYWLNAFNTLVSSATHFFPRCYLFYSPGHGWRLLFQTPDLTLRFPEGFVPDFECDSDSSGPYLPVPAVRGIFPLNFAVRATSPDQVSVPGNIYCFQPYDFTDHPTTQPRPIDSRGNFDLPQFRHPHISSVDSPRHLAYLCHSSAYNEFAPSRYFHQDFFSLFSDTIAVLSNYNPSSPFFAAALISRSGPISRCPDCNATYNSRHNCTAIRTVTNSSITNYTAPFHPPCAIRLLPFDAHCVLPIDYQFVAPEGRRIAAAINQPTYQGRLSPLYYINSDSNHKLSYHKFTRDSQSLVALIRHSDQHVTDVSSSAPATIARAFFVTTSKPILSEPVPSDLGPTPSPILLPHHLIANAIDIKSFLSVSDTIVSTHTFTLNNNEYNDTPLLYIPWPEHVYYTNRVALRLFCERSRGSSDDLFREGGLGRLARHLASLPPESRPLLLIDSSSPTSRSPDQDTLTDPVPTPHLNFISNFFRTTVIPPYIASLNSLYSNPHYPVDLSTYNNAMSDLFDRVRTLALTIANSQETPAHV